MTLSVHSMKPLGPLPPYTPVAATSQRRLYQASERAAGQYSDPTRGIWPGIEVEQIWLPGRRYAIHDNSIGAMQRETR